MGKLHGCVLVAGTGSIAYGFSEDGKEARAAGGGPILGDWGRYVPTFLCIGFNLLHDEGMLSLFNFIS